MRCKYGAPPHGGIAFGLDRLVDADGRRRQHPRRDRLPEDADARRILLTDAPTEVDEKQLRELHIRVRVPQA